MVTSHQYRTSAAVGRDDEAAAICPKGTIAGTIALRRSNVDPRRATRSKPSANPAKRTSWNKQNQTNPAVQRASWLTNEKASYVAACLLVFNCKLEARTVTDKRRKLPFQANIGKPL